MTLNDSQKYLDSASTTAVDKRVLNEMLPYFTEIYGNASSNHSFGQKAKKGLEQARSRVASLINVRPNEIIFTSGATESINLALKGFVESNIDRGNHIITAKTEHKAVLNTCEYLETKGVEVTYLDVNENGLISLEQLRNSIKKSTILIVIMYVNNETGIIQPIKEIGAIAKESNIAFFCDGTQSIGKIAVDIEDENIDMLCFSGHKLKGPKGVGVLYKKDTIALTPLIHGGGQENGMRGGTYNTPLIVGLGKACELAQNEFEENLINLNTKREKIQSYYEDNKIGVVNFKHVKTAPHIISITLLNQGAEDYLLMNHKKFVASTGSACNAEVMEPSHVLRAMGVEDNSTIRISI